MKLPLSKLGYRFNSKTNVWSRPDYIGIAYSDGDEVEQRIAAVIEQASDLTVLSTELRQHCIDWPSLYHLSGTRSNILRPFQRTLAGAEVLEIGAGCGAITRYLGECGANVLALEGSPRRAAIARSRTSGFENVAILAEKFDQFQCEYKFDVITLIGVLEYANLFTAGENPPLAMLAWVRAMLKPNGKLIIAIENQLGLKYFAGATEDHLGQPMVGIEGRYRKDQPQTWGRKVLMGMLEQTGFAASEFLAPFPDYKLPVSILTEEGFSNKNFDAAAFAWQSARRDPQLPDYCNFSLELAWPEVFRNDLGLDFANSFLIIASPNAKKLIPAGVLAYHYSVERTPAYCKETVFILSDGGDIRVKYRRLGTPNKDADKANNPLIKFILPDSDEYVFGRPLSLEFIIIVTRDGWTFDQVARFILRYLSIVETFAKSAGIQISMTSPYTELPGEFFDVIPQNIIIREDARPSLIDKEWQLVNPIEIGHLLLRSFLSLFYSVTLFGRPASGTNMTRYQFIDGAFAAIGLRLQEGDCTRYIALESDIQQSVFGRVTEIYLTLEKDQPLPILSLSQAIWERDVKIAIISQVIRERDEQIANLNMKVAIISQVIRERDEQIANLNMKVAIISQVIRERDEQIANLNQSIVERDAKIAERDG
jgi:2-polyprenyl-3-methyl-5-hydroxy-6-metoxy-1,4-benzoquinol methylase